MVHDQLYCFFSCFCVFKYGLDNPQSATPPKMDSMFQAFFTCPRRRVTRLFARWFFFHWLLFFLSNWELETR